MIQRVNSCSAKPIALSKKFVLLIGLGLSACSSEGIPISENVEVDRPGAGSFVSSVSAELSSVPDNENTDSVVSEEIDPPEERIEIEVAEISTAPTDYSVVDIENVESTDLNEQDPLPLAVAEKGEEAEEPEVPLIPSAALPETSESPSTLGKMITMRWSAADSNDLGYTIYYSTDNGESYDVARQIYSTGGSGVGALEATLSSIDDLGISGSKDVCFTIAAWSAFGESGHSIPQCVAI